jgi:sugar phosphate isomerase/epimerase
VTITGIADEASPQLAEQIRVHRQLGWSSLELRLIGKTNVCELEERAFEEACRTLQEQQMGVICFASPLANWARPITSDFRRDLVDLERSAPRMRRLGTRYIRIMSYPNDGLGESDWRREAIRRVRELARLAEGEGITLLHENCSGWGSAAPGNQQMLMEEVASPALRIVFDTGNPVGEGHAPEETWEFYRAARPYIEHVHIKDCRRDEQGQIVYTFPGEGQSSVREILGELLRSGYQGAFSVEPHIAAQVHLGTSAAGAQARDTYLEYARRTMSMLAELSAAG